jgi:hypothetical protein
VDQIDADTIRPLFYLALVVVGAVQLLIFISGPQTIARFCGLLFGVAVMISIALIGQMAAARMTKQAIMAMGIDPFALRAETEARANRPLPRPRIVLRGTLPAHHYHRRHHH